MTAEEAVIADAPSSLDAVGAPEDAHEQPGASGEGDGSTGTEPATTPETSASAVGEADRSSDPGGEQTGVLTGDEPA
jgi:hypothetical protein